MNASPTSHAMAPTISPSSPRTSETQDQGDIRIAQSVDRPPDADEGIHPDKMYSPLAIPVLALLMPASLFGVLTRLGLVALATYEGCPIFPLAYAQGLGCFVMGFMVPFKEPLGEFYGPLYTAITAGFCGSLTTFSSWQLQIFDAWIDAGGFHRGSLRDFMDGIGQTVFTLSIGLSSLAFGHTVASHLAPYLPPPTFLRRRYRHALTLFSVLTYAAILPTYFLLSPAFRPQATAALLFAFPGTFTRYLLGILLNRRINTLPLGTLLANVLGTALLGAFTAIQGAPGPVSSDACAVLQGLGDGYCGCATTVSTFAVEVRELRGWRAVRYALVSWVLAQVSLVVVLGSAVWSGRVSKERTCVFK